MLVSLVHAWLFVLLLWRCRCLLGGLFVGVGFLGGVVVIVVAVWHCRRCLCVVVCGVCGVVVVGVVLSRTCCVYVVFGCLRW